MKSIMPIILIALFSAGCTHPLRITNAKKVLEPVNVPAFNPVAVGFTSVGSDSLLNAAVEEAVYNAAIRASKKNYVEGGDFRPDYVCSLSKQMKFKAHGQNFLIACPGFVVFTHALVGYKYTATIQTQSTLRDYESNLVSQVDILTPVEFRHCSFPRGAAPSLCGWLLPGYGACSALPGLIFALSYDKRATPELMQKVEHAYGRYVASRIVEQVYQAQLHQAQPVISRLEPKEGPIVVEGEAFAQTPPAEDEYAVYFMRVNGNEVGEPEVSVKKLSESDRQTMRLMSQTGLAADPASLENLLMSLGASPSEFFGQVRQAQVFMQRDEEVIALRPVDLSPTPLL